MIASNMFLATLFFEFFHKTLIQRRRYPFFDIVTSVFVKFFRKYFLQAILFLGYYDISYIAYKHRFANLLQFELHHYILLFVIIDFGYYWAHRMGHCMRFFWIPHSVHHLPNQLMIVRSSQQSLSGLFLSPVYIASVPLTLLGVTPIAFWTLYSLNSLYQEYLHNEFVPRLGIVELLFNTPSLHRVHHSVKLEHIDKNFGGVFSVWDRIFGTFQCETGTIEVYGILPPVENKSLLTPLIYEFQEFKRFFMDIRYTHSISSKFSLFWQSPFHSTVKTQPQPKPNIS